MLRTCTFLPGMVALLWSPHPAIAGALVPQPRIGKEEAVRSAEGFLREPGVKFSDVTLSRGGSPRRGIFYRLRGTPDITVTVDAQTGKVTYASWLQRRMTARLSANQRRRLTDDEAVAQAREFLRPRDSELGNWSLLKCSHFAQDGRIMVGFGEVNEIGIALGTGATVWLDAASGEVCSYTRWQRQVHVPTVPLVTREEAERAARAILAYPTGNVTGGPMLEEDTLGDQRLIYALELSGRAEVTDPALDKVVREMETPVDVDAITGEVCNVALGDWSLTFQKPPLTRPYRSGPHLLFQGEYIHLIRKPIVRGEHVLISKILLEGIGAKIAFEEASGKLVLEKAADPIVCTVGSLDATQDGVPFQLPVPPETVNGHPYLPVVLVTRLLKMPVRWNAEKDRLYIDCEGLPEPE
ncbi:MAG: hypothetical protein COZ06_28835 [Armatimonadetes bacterium CG_4_10_14_3_um_filter_66_18]|nr:hypothetical protein [Armatimonadota bacterium]PIX46924.1 MAG: hypothetical protein COZ57_09830 [Armatimonadetes bacterium CG_4_8_14_3_um_filter_66_20]PIY39992.1 MAG: hypothetical protein COZ06_28835 [Armatimonadetes bacterium CG_4_10_14_3_um_filter_66_18]PIZ32964.1 MAG: hypothetical protein COY42_30615 [Armatimonadetes bacterium CG_4_10_14_0_8_um_filter_66_14]